MRIRPIEKGMPEAEFRPLYPGFDECRCTHAAQPEHAADVETPQEACVVAGQTRELRVPLEYPGEGEVEGEEGQKRGGSRK